MRESRQRHFPDKKLGRHQPTRSCCGPALHRSTLPDQRTQIRPSNIRAAGWHQPNENLSLRRGPGTFRNLKVPAAENKQHERLIHASY